jgi:hypothetical protein
VERVGEHSVAGQLGRKAQIPLVSVLTAFAHSGIYPADHLHVADGGSFGQVGGGQDARRSLTDASDAATGRGDVVER